MRFIPAKVGANPNALRTLLSSFERVSLWLVRAAGAAALGFGPSALLSLWIFARGFWAPSVVDIGDLGAEISSTEWYALMAAELLLQLPLFVGAMAALFKLRYRAAMAVRRPDPPH